MRNEDMGSCCCSVEGWEAGAKVYKVLLDCG